eukprot:TRINITY_DN2127_c0_g1_i1.p1 TRINITY_DN2127_c0_g1~~TRINITY_DN2127_c0_g1_i1.p1  ORF type:complete len:460 (+),score=138.57 TRINITY_DN2127_c0_g1_i1:1597-2976(+)
MNQNNNSNETQSLSLETIGSLRKEFISNKQNIIAYNSVAVSTFPETIINQNILNTTDFVFSNEIEGASLAATSQKSSGRCWIFACLNLLRVDLCRKLNLSTFEFSQNYVYFFDKLERANYFFESIIETADKEINDRVVEFLLSAPLGDGGQWHYFVEIVKKYGLVPKSIMPETKCSSSTRKMNALIRTKLRQGASVLRKEIKANGMENVKEIKDKLVSDIYRMLAIHIGVPPSSFTFNYRNKDKEFFREKNITPLAFFEKHFGIDYFDQFVCIVDDPRKNHLNNQNYTVQYLGNVWESGTSIYLNVDIDILKEATKKSILKDDPVWFGCDVGKALHRTKGIWDLDLYNYDIYDTELETDKETRLNYQQSKMTHSMLFTGIDIDEDDNTILKWKVENSWGKDRGNKGYYCMNDNWFVEYMYEVVVKKEYIQEYENVMNAIDSEPIILPCYDPMGTLANFD